MVKSEGQKPYCSPCQTLSLFTRILTVELKQFCSRPTTKNYTQFTNKLNQSE